ncbi:MAG: hypothetical protein IJG63_04500 [Oscillospiraceae bacterium]|nr:hypothetical protein [Oscillospiraceae bacterium]
MSIGRVCIRPGALIFAALAISFVDGVVLTPLFISAAAHEAGHILMISFCGAGVYRLELGFFGAAIGIRGELSYGDEILCALAGPMANLLLALVTGRLGCRIWSGVNILLFAFNMLPFSVLDGGRALFMLTAKAAGPAAAEWAAIVADAALLFVMALATGFLYARAAAGPFSLSVSALFLLMCLSRVRTAAGSR